MDDFRITGATARQGRVSYGRCHLKGTQFFKSDMAFYKAPCKQCGHPTHERKCDFVVGMTVENGVRKQVACNMPLCRGCAQTYAQVDRRNTLDYCPEHDKIMLESIKNSKL